MSATTLNEIIKLTGVLTLEEQLRLAAYLIEKASWQVAISQVPEKNTQAGQEDTIPSVNRWRAFFESTERPTEDFMLERVDLPPQTREIF